MKSTLLFICSLLCLAFFSWQLMLTAAPIEPSKEAFEQVVDPQGAKLLLKNQQGFNWVIGMTNMILAFIGVAASFICLFLLRRPNILHWFRVGLFGLNIIIMLTCATLFCVTMVETMQATPQCLKLCWPWQDSFWIHAIHRVQQAGMFLGLCCGMLGGVNCTAFYYSHARRRMYYSN